MRVAVGLILSAALAPFGAVAQEMLSADSVLISRWNIGAGMEARVGLSRIVDAVRRDGMVWVLDSDRVLKLDSEGLFLTQFGGPGAGPGEMLAPVRLEVDSVVRVYDPRVNRVTRFDLNGGLLGTSSMIDPSAGTMGMRQPLRSGYSVDFTGAYISNLGDSDPFNHLLLFGPSATDTVASFRAPIAVWSHEGGARLVRTQSGEGGAWRTIGDTLLVVVDGHDGVVEWRCAPTFTPCGSHSLQMAPRPFDRQAERLMLDELEAAVGRRVRLANIRDVPEWVSVAVAIAVDEDGTAWIQNDGGPAGGHVFSVVSREGGLQDRIRFSSPFRVLQVTRDGVLLSGRGQYDEAVLYWMEWTRKIHF
jgi:hypothetical protein